MDISIAVPSPRHGDSTSALASTASGTPLVGVVNTSRPTAISPSFSLPPVSRGRDSAASNSAAARLIEGGQTVVHARLDARDVSDASSSPSHILAAAAVAPASDRPSDMTFATVEPCERSQSSSSSSCMSNASDLSTCQSAPATGRGGGGGVVVGAALTECPRSIGSHEEMTTINTLLLKSAPGSTQQQHSKARGPAQQTLEHNGSDKNSAQIYASDLLLSDHAVSDVERFDGKIVYNPDGSAYIIEESEGSEEDEMASNLTLPQLEGAIVDGRNTCIDIQQTASLPQIASAFYVSRHANNLYNAVYGGQSLVRNSKMASEVMAPVMHSYRVYSLRHHQQKDNEHKVTKLDPPKVAANVPMVDYSSVPIKPILMCFVCKLSFGFAKSFVAHAMADHSVILDEEEKEILRQQNTSAILQLVGKSKDPVVSFLEPVGPSSTAAAAATPTTHAKNDASVVKRNTPAVPSDDCSPTDGSINDVGDTRDAGDAMNYTMNDTSINASMTGNGRASLSPSAGSMSSSPSPVTSLSPVGGSNVPTSNNAIGSYSPVLMCPDHPNGRPATIECPRCDLAAANSRGPLALMATRNSCKTLKCPKCNWHYKYQETLEIHMKEKHPENETSCIYCLTNQPHPRLARGETYTCGYKPYRCELCNYSTTTKGNLSIHMQSDKHLNNAQELQNGGLPNSLNTSADNCSLNTSLKTSLSSSQSAPNQQTAVSNSVASHTSPNTAASQVSSNSGGGVATASSSSNNNNNNNKPKPTWRCDVCNYETNVARNLRIHMTSEKHTHNMIMLQQNVKRMQQLPALALRCRSANCSI